MNRTRSNSSPKANPALGATPTGGKITRRAFLQGSAALVAASAVNIPVLARGEPKPFEARYYERLPDGRVHCVLCPTNCRPGDKERGNCGVRENRKGTYYALDYGRPCALHLDPIEKKPFFHVLPGTDAVSLATVGCNLHCKFCQNWQISQASPEEVQTQYTAPGEIVDRAISAKAPSIAYTYSEPTVFIEYMEDIARLGRAKGLKNVVVSNGYIQKAPLADLCGLVDAIKIDLKAFHDEYYGNVCGGKLQPVLDTITSIHASKAWLEIVYLVVPTLNDNIDRVRAMARWIFTTLGPDVPLHFSRFFPQYLLANLPPTPLSTLDEAYRACREAGLHYVYVGNVPGHEGENTYCPKCKNRIVARSGYRLEKLDVIKGKCRFCGNAIPGIWQEAS